MAALPDIARAVVAELKGGDASYPVPKLIDERIRRGCAAKDKGTPSRRLYWRFWRGDHYFYINDKNVLTSQDTTLIGGEKPPHRVRQKRNLIHSIVEGKVSTATRRTPSYDVAPSTTDPEDRSAATLASRVAAYGYEAWGVRRARVKAVTSALVAGEGFAMPYFDPNVGPYRQIADEATGELKTVGAGEVKLLILNGDQVAWEEGVDFDDSPWWLIERAMPVGEVERLPGFMGGKLKPDADTGDTATERKGRHLVLVREYFERPCPDYVEGRKLTIAGGKVICPEETYPSRDSRGEIVDRPVIHRLSYTIDPGQDRDRGLVEHLIDLQRTVNDCVNKQIEWKNRALNPQLLVPRGANLARKDDTPGAVLHYNPIGSQKPEWERPPAIPGELDIIRAQAVQDMREIASDTQFDADPGTTARTAQAAIENNLSRWASFLQALADFDSSVMAHCLQLAAQHYSEPRLLQVRGRFGWEPINDFQGADLRGQTDVRVLPDSLEPRTRSGIRSEIQMFAQMFPGVLSPQAVMAAMHGGLAENLLQSYERDVARANYIVQTLAQGPDVAMALPPSSPTPEYPDGIPGWMPRPQDDFGIHKTVVGDAMKTPWWDQLDAPSKEMFNLYWQALEHLEGQEALRQRQMQSQMAEQQGLANAAVPQLGPGAAKPMPSMPGPADGSTD